MCVGQPLGGRRADFRAVAGSRAGLPRSSLSSGRNQVRPYTLCRSSRVNTQLGLAGTITEEQGEIHVAQGKVIGGGSSINGQAMQRGFPEDFDSWADLGTNQWSSDT